MSAASFVVNDRAYVVPDAPVVVICIDGSEPAYHESAVTAGRMPWLKSVLAGRGSSWPAECAMPALTNPNNLSIATGRPPSVHGISGNYLFDEETGSEVLMNDPRFLRAPTLFAAAADAGLNVAVVTAKDKLRRLLGSGLVGRAERSTVAVCFSAEKADEVTVEKNGIDEVLDMVGLPLPSVYSAELSQFALAAGVELLRTQPLDLLYVSLTDYIQHKNAPGTPAADDFYAMIDRYAAELDELGAIVVLTADHGMSAKTDAEGNPRVIYLEEEIRHIVGDASGDRVRVILPINDPYTVHHGALGTIAYVHLSDDVDRDLVIGGVAALDGIEEVQRSESAARAYDLPVDRIGDLVVIARKDTVLGRFTAWHDLTQLKEPLRSHGGLGEKTIPFIINRPIADPRTILERGVVHNYDAYWVGTTLVSAAEHAAVLAGTSASPGPAPAESAR